MRCISRWWSILLLASGCNCEIRFMISIKFKCTERWLFSQHTNTHTFQAYLQEEGYNLSSSNILLSGASAGALSATLAKTGVSPYDATKLALSMSDDAGILDRPLGLQGVWGNIIRDWLDCLLPTDAVERARDGVRKQMNWRLHNATTDVVSFDAKLFFSFFFLPASNSCYACPIIR